MDSGIEVRGLTKQYGAIRALDGIDLSVSSGAIFGFLGPNGSGKTTTIRCMLDLIRPNGGSIRIAGLDPQADPVGVRRLTGYLPGELRLDGTMTGEGLLRYLARLRPNQVEWRYVRQLGERLDLNLDRKIGNLSSGNKQKIGIVQALMSRPPLLLLDEPTIGLDPLIQQEVLRLIREAREQGATVFLSSHILSEVQAVTDRVAIVRHGRVVEVADTDTLIGRALRRVQVRFQYPVAPDLLAHLPGVTVLAADETLLQLQVEGGMDALIKSLAHHPVLDFETERPSLEEIFLTYYRDETTEAV